MKCIRIFSVMLAAAMLFTVGAAASTFVPSIEIKDDPKLEDYEAPDNHTEDEMIVTPLDHYFDELKELHSDIADSLKAAYKDLKEELLHDLVEDFAERWDLVTGGAPLENALVSHLFDVRLLCELDGGSHNALIPGQDRGVEVTFKLRVLGLTTDDDFLVLYRCDENDEWIVLEKDKYKLLEDNILEITGKTIGAYAIVQDNSEPPVVGPDDPDSPQTGVSAYFFPAIAGAVLFAGAAVVCLRKATKKNAV